MLIKVDILPALRQGVKLKKPVYLWGKLRAVGTTVPARSLREMDHRAVKNYLRRGIFAVKAVKTLTAEVS